MEDCLPDEEADFIWQVGEVWHGGFDSQEDGHFHEIFVVLIYSVRYVSFSAIGRVQACVLRGTKPQKMSCDALFMLAFRMERKSEIVSEEQ